MGCLVLAGMVVVGCQKKPTGPGAGPAMQGLPVQTVTVTMAPVAQSSQYEATIKSRRSTMLLPQVSGLLTAINVRSGQQVKSGQVLMEIDPRQQQAALASQSATERQKKALFDYNAVEVERQRKLFEAGVTSRDAYEQAQQAYQNSQADYESAVEARKTQDQMLTYYTIRAPFDGVVGDIPVHVGDYVSPSLSPATVLTTVDENDHLEAYIYIPTERASEVRPGLGIDLTDDSGKLLEKTSIDFISPEVDSTLQGILVKAPVSETSAMLRNAQLVEARVIWSTKPMAVVPVLAVTRQGEQSFVYLVQKQNGMAIAHRAEVTLGDTVGNNYSIISGLNAGDQVIVSGTQFLVDGMPVIPMGGPPQPSPPAAKPAGAQGMNGAAPAADSRAQAKNANAPAPVAEPKPVSASHLTHRKHRRARARSRKQTQRVAVS
jgi:RND family efflux transporter MFP subunit